jgi:hypothetical protein
MAAVILAVGAAALAEPGALDAAGALEEAEAGALAGEAGALDAATELAGAGDAGRELAGAEEAGAVSPPQAARITDTVPAAMVPRNCRRFSALTFIVDPLLAKIWHSLWD